MRGQAAWIGRLGAGLGGAALATLAAMRGLLFPWVPVFLGFGIALWFALPSEPGLAVYLAAGSAGAIALLIARVTPEHARPFLMALACVIRHQAYRRRWNRVFAEFGAFGPWLACTYAVGVVIAGVVLTILLMLVRH